MMQPQAPLTATPNNLPAQPTPFIGREQAMAAINDLLRDPAVRLVTLTGPGGVGKTRLALQAATAVASAFADGVYLVALAPIADPNQVLLAIAQELATGEVGDQSLFPIIQAALQGRHILLLLDNFEQVASAAIEIADLLAACSTLKVLVTSRVALHVRAEHEYAVPPLAVPALKRLPDPATLSQVEAVRLFLQRAQAVKPEFAVTGANARAVASICARLDGLPLAIELAAARIKYFPPQALLARLEQGLGILTGGAKDLPARQQTLRAAIAWSYDQLAPDEQALFRRCAVFVDGYAISAVAQVCAADENDVLETLASLVDKSLMRQVEESAGDEPRFWMLQTLREFGLERLQEAGELDAIRDAHAVYFLALAEEAAPYLRGHGQGPWLARIEQEHENLRAGLNWLLERTRHAESQDAAEQTLQFATAMYRFWYIRGYFREGLHLLDQALALSTAISPSRRADGLLVAGDLAFYVDDYDRAERWYQEAYQITQQMADTNRIAPTLLALGSIAWARGEFSKAYAIYTEAATLAQTAGDPWNQGRALMQVGRIVMMQGDYARSVTMIDQALALYRALDDHDRIGWALSLKAQAIFWGDHDGGEALRLAEDAQRRLRAELIYPSAIYNTMLLGQILLHRGASAQALAYATESVAAFRELGDRASTAEALIGLARVVNAQGEFAAAERHLRESLALLQAIHDQEIMPACLECLAVALAGQGDLDRAARLWSHAQGVRDAVGAPLPPIYQAAHTQALAQSRATLGADIFAAAWSQGQEQSIDAILAQPAAPVRSVTPATTTPLASQASQPAAPHDLTPREVEILRLVAQGLTDAQIAAQLVISPRTVNAHLTSIYRKIQVSTRSAATRYAVEHHLV